MAIHSAGVIKAIEEQDEAITQQTATTIARLSAIDTTVEAITDTIATTASKAESANAALDRMMQTASGSAFLEVTQGRKRGSKWAGYSEAMAAEVEADLANREAGLGWMPGFT